MENLKRTRTLSKAHLKQIAATFKSLLDSPDTKVERFQEAMSDWCLHKDTLNETQDKILELISADELENAVKEFHDFLRPLTDTKCLVDSKIAELLPRDDDNHSVVSHNDFEGFSNSLTRKLPKLSLERFDGVSGEYNSFIEAFQENIGKQTFSDGEKLTYLAGLLDGEAKEVIKGFSLVGHNYKAVIEALKSRYGNKEAATIRHLVALLHLPTPQESSGMKYVGELYELYHKIVGHVRSLEALGHPMEPLGIALSSFIVWRFPKSIALEWSRQCEGNLYSLDKTQEFLLKGAILSALRHSGAVRGVAIGDDD